MKDFFRTKVNFAAVVNCDLETVDRLKHYLADEGIRVIYQKTSLAKLQIQEEKHG